MTTITKSRKVRITGDTAGYMHSRLPDTVGVVTSIQGSVAKVKIADDPTGAKADSWWIGLADLQPVGRGKARNRVFTVVLDLNGQALHTRISAPSATEALEAAHKALVVRVYEQ